MGLFDRAPKSTRVLIIDDEPALTEMLTIRLEANKFTVSAVNSGKEGLARAEAELPDVIILDLMMPEMDGYEVASHLKQNERTKDIPIIILTACGVIWDLEMHAHLKQAKETGAIIFLTKPYIAADIIDGINLCMEWRKRQK